MTGEPVTPIFFHVDLDAFYASVEQTDFPELAGKPVIIGAMPGHRGVVSACSYEARKYGVHSAMPISQAYRLCPNGIYRPPRMRRYQEVSREVMRRLASYTPVFHQISIDEATLDMSGTQRLLGRPFSVAEELKRKIRSETAMSVSIGIAPNRYLAKLASEYCKPDGIFEVEKGREIDFLDRLQLSHLWGLGKKTIERLEELGISTVPALREFPEHLLQAVIGKAATSYLRRVASGADPGVYSLEPKSRSISSEVTFEFDTRDRGAIQRTMLDLAHQVMFRLLDEEAQSKTVQVKVRYADFATTTAQLTLRHWIASAEELYQVAMELLRKRWDGSELIRLVGLGLSSVEEPEGARQGELFEDAYDRKKRVEETVLALRKRHKGLVVKASLLDHDARRDVDHKGKEDS